MNDETTAVVIARALVEDDVEVRPEPLQEIRVRVGQPVTFRFAYHITERTARKEVWTLSLKTRYDDVERVAANEHGDRPFLRDAIWEALEETFTFAQEGSAVVHFDAEACMERSGWLSGRSPVSLCHAVRGAVSVMVLP